MKSYSFDTLVHYVLKDLCFKKSRVLVIGQWHEGIDKMEPGSTWKITFYFERMFKGYIRQVEKLNGTKLPEGITLEMDAAPISVYNELIEQEVRNDVRDKRYWRTLRDDFNIHWYLRRNEMITILDYVLCSIKLPQKCAVMVFGYRNNKGRGLHRFKDLDLLFVFPVREKRQIREVDRLKRKKLSADINLRIHCFDLEQYKKFLSGELPYFDEETRKTGIVLYDYFHRKRLNVEFIKKEKRGLPSRHSLSSHHSLSPY